MPAFEHIGKPCLGGRRRLALSLGNIVCCVPIDAIAGDRNQPETLTTSQRLAGHEICCLERSDAAPGGVPGISEHARNAEPAANGGAKTIRAHQQITASARAVTELDRHPVCVVLEVFEFVIEMDRDPESLLDERVQQLCPVEHGDSHSETGGELACRCARQNSAFGAAEGTCLRHETQGVQALFHTQLIERLQRVGPE